MCVCLFCPCFRLCCCSRLCVFFTFVHSCSLLHTTIFILACVSLFLFSLVCRCSNPCLHVVALTCICPWLFPSTRAHSPPIATARPLLFPPCCCSPPVVAPRLLLFLAYHCSPLLFFHLLLFPIHCCSRCYSLFFKVPLGPLLLLLLLAHYHSLFVFPHMVLLPPFSSFIGSFWSYKQQTKTNKQQGKFFFSTFYLIISKKICF